MSQTKILIDTCSYLRLAQNLHPLLGAPFGSQGYACCAHEALVSEFERKARLKTKFDWFKDNDYVENRKFKLNLSRAQVKAIETTFEFMWQHVVDENLGLSKVDVRILATASELQIRMISDDVALQGMAAMYGVHVLSSLELMKLMLDEKHINADKVDQVVSQWRYDRDIPANLESEFARLFGRKAPRG